MTPGTNLLAFETGVGWIVRGWAGAIIALVAGSVPCSTLAVLMTFAYESFSQNILVARAIRGALAATPSCRRCDIAVISNLAVAAMAARNPASANGVEI